MSLDDDWSAADRLSRQGSWGVAGPAWMDLARRCRAQGLDARARDAASRAADALRRDDRPADARDALTLAWELGQRTTVDALQLVAVQVDLGLVPEALTGAIAALASAADPAARALAIDGLCNVQLLAGDVAGARASLADLRRVGQASSELAVLFRGALIDRLDGRLEPADLALARVIEALEPFHAAASGVAAACDERGSIALVRAALARVIGADPAPHVDAALGHLDDGADAWHRGRRQAGRLRNEALQAFVRFSAAGDVDVEPVDRALAWADRRGLVVLAAEVGAWRAAMTGEQAGLGRAVALPAPLARGQARLHWGMAQEDAAAIEAAIPELVDDLPWCAVALHTLGSLRRDATVRSRGVDLARAALTRLEV